MFRARKLRVLIWLALIAGLLAIPIHDRAGGEFHVRPVVRREVRAPIAGFLREINADEGDLVFGRFAVDGDRSPGANQQHREKESGDCGIRSDSATFEMRSAARGNR